MGMQVKPLTFRKLAGQLAHIKESNVHMGIQIHNGEEQVV
jgi:hypothetical protein